VVLVVQVAGLACW